MQVVTVSPGIRFVTLHMADPASLSASATVPAAKVLPELPEVAENAANVPAPATRPTAPTTSTVARIARSRLMPPPPPPWNGTRGPRSRSVPTSSVRPAGRARW